MLLGVLNFFFCIMYMLIIFMFSIKYKFYFMYDFVCFIIDYFDGVIYVFCVNEYWVCYE